MVCRRSELKIHQLTWPETSQHLKTLQFDGVLSSVEFLATILILAQVEAIVRERLDLKETVKFSRKPLASFRKPINRARIKEITAARATASSRTNSKRFLKMLKCKAIKMNQNLSPNCLSLTTNGILKFFSFRCRLGFISQWGALAGRYAALYPTGFPWPSTTQRMPFQSSNGKEMHFSRLECNSITFVLKQSGLRFKIIDQSIVMCRIDNKKKSQRF